MIAVLKENDRKQKETNKYMPEINKKKVKLKKK